MTSPFEAHVLVDLWGDARGITMEWERPDGTTGRHSESWDVGATVAEAWRIIHFVRGELLAQGEISTVWADRFGVSP